MKVEFKKAQFKSLLELVYLGEGVVNGHRMPDETISSYEDIYPEERFTKFLDLEEHYQEILSAKGIDTLKPD